MFSNPIEPRCFTLSVSMRRSGPPPRVSVACPNGRFVRAEGLCQPPDRSVGGPVKSPCTSSRSHPSFPPRFTAEILEVTQPQHHVVLDVLAPCLVQDHDGDLVPSGRGHGLGHRIVQPAGQRRTILNLWREQLAHHIRSVATATPAHRHACAAEDGGDPALGAVLPFQSARVGSLPAWRASRRNAICRE